MRGIANFAHRIIGFLMSSVPDSNVRYHCMVIGNPIAHSKSPDLHQAFAQQTGNTLSYQRQYCPNDVDSFTAVIEAFLQAVAQGQM